MDARHKPTEKDDEMLDLLEGAHVPTVVVATKIDKVKRSERAKNLRRIRETLGLDGEAALVPFSSVTKEGVKEVWRIIGELSKDSV